jgi:glycosyltransferase involved in cell wall biosynthesis
LRALVALEQHFYRDTRGRFYGDGPATFSSWSPYLDVFDEILLLARAGPNPDACLQDRRADGPGVCFQALPEYRGPWQYLRKFPQLKAQVREAVTKCDAYILRVPGLVGSLAWQEVQRLAKPYALEVVGDPWDALGPGTWPSIFRPVFRRAATHNLRRMCDRAMAVHYVTERALQRRYPPGKRAFTVGASDALMDSAFASPATLEYRYRRIEARTPSAESRAQRFRIGFSGSLSQLYKGPDVLLRAAARFPNDLNFEIVLVGDGHYSCAIKDLARRLGLAGRTRFAGQLPFGKAIFDFLDSVDLFVVPSRAEGMPRALLEAMARGCPCIGSAVGGIPELLGEADLVSPGNPAALAEKIVQVSRDSRLLKEMSLRNLERSRQFDPDRLKQARRAFLRFVRLRSQAQEKSSACSQAA